MIGGKQLGFTDYELTTAKQQTKREKFLAEMEAVVPWQALIDLIEPHYPKASKKGGRPPYPLATMLRIHLLQQWYPLSDPAMEEALIDVPSMGRFAGIELISVGSRMRPRSSPSGSATLAHGQVAVTCWRSMGWVSRSLRPSKPTSARGA